jgi:hypothetical protein
MKKQMPRDIPLAIVIFATVTAVALRLRAGGRVTADMIDVAGHGMTNPPGIPVGGPGSSVDQMDYIFHELHADGRHALCTVCGSQYWHPREK